MIAYSTEKVSGGYVMGIEKSSYRILGGLSKGLSRIFIILRTRKIYGYNSVFERIFRCLFNTRRNRKQSERLKRRIEIERV
jgi:hypothetical protein